MLMTELRKRFIKDVKTKTVPELLVVAIKLPTGAIETIVNTSKLADKIQYYMEAYDDEFRLKLIQQSRL